jgi:hypothetical protein
VVLLVKNSLYNVSGIRSLDDSMAPVATVTGDSDKRFYCSEHSELLQ